MHPTPRAILLNALEAARGMPASTKTAPAFSSQSGDGASAAGAEDLPKDSRILEALARHNRIDVAGALYPCAGVYAVAETTGAIRKGDRVMLI